MVDTLLLSADGTSCGASIVKMSVDFPDEAARCQRFLSERAQSCCARGAEGGLAAMLYPKSLPLPLADPRAPSVISERNKPPLANKCVNLRAKRCGFRRAEVIVDDEPAAAAEA